MATGRLGGDGGVTLMRHSRLARQSGVGVPAQAVIVV